MRYLAKSIALLAALMLGAAPSAALALGAPAAAARPSLYKHDLARASAHLRIAIEIRPSQLAEYLSSSELVCGLGERAAARHDEPRAEADWSTLAQIVREFDRREMRAIEQAYARADESLLALERSYSRAWSGQPARVRELKLGVTRSRQGIQRLRLAMAKIEAAFPSWEARDCDGAIAGIEAGVRQLEPGLRTLNAGMQRLWRLAE